MNKFNPPIESRDTEELIAIANCDDTDFWQEEAIELARIELDKRGVTREEQEELLKHWENLNEALNRTREKQLEFNATLSYSFMDLLKYFLFAPFFIIGLIPTEYSLTGLWQNNFKKRFFQRILMYIFGVVLFFLIISYSFWSEEQERIKEIENTDLSDWEENRLQKEGDTTE